MSNYKFSILKYKQWLREREKLDNITIDIMLYMNEYDKMDGLDHDYLWQQGKIVLKDWCDKKE